MLKVLQVNDYPPGPGGGAEVLLARTVALLREQGAAVEVFSAADLPDARRTVRRYLDNPIARHALAARLEALRPDVVHLHNFYHVLSPGVLLELRRHKRARPLRVVMTAHDYHLVCPSAGGTWFRSRVGTPRPIDPERVGSLGYLLSRRWDHRGRLFSWLKTLQHLWGYRLRGAHATLDDVICPSRFLQRLVGALGAPTVWLPHPAPPPVLAQLERPGPLHLVFAGRLEPEKGLHEFLCLLPADFGATLTVVGDGHERTVCEETCRRRGFGTKVRFLGRLNHADALAQIARAHVLVLPSRCLESYGLTLLEALAAGTNVLASDLGAMRETVEAAGVGYLFKPGDALGLARQLARIAERHADGTLNRFDVRAFLAQRSEAGYVRGLLRVYAGKAA